jgi:hypothetical protein
MQCPIWALRNDSVACHSYDIGFKASQGRFLGTLALCVEQLFYEYPFRYRARYINMEQSVLINAAQGEFHAKTAQTGEEIKGLLEEALSTSFKREA